MPDQSLVTADAFKQGMRRLGGAVTIVSVAHEKTWAGLTATAVTSLSSEPPRLLACINQQGATFETVSKGRKLAVNVLGRQHLKLAERFAGLDGTPETERFTEGDWISTDLGVPRLEGALVSFACSVESIFDNVSHGIVVGNIAEIHLGPGGRDGVSGCDFDDPLCYIDGRWKTLKDI